MNVKLSPELERRVTEHVARHSRYKSPEAFIERAIEVFLGESDEELRSRLISADGEIDRGEFSEYTPETIHRVAQEVQARGLKRMRR